MTINRLSGAIEASSSSAFYASCGKRVFDIFFTVLALPIIVPLVCILACLVALDGGNPFERLDRVGRNGRVFGMWRLRLARLPASDRDAGRVRGEISDPRCATDTHLGKLGLIMQKSSLDELPQFFNVLIGDMSIVGPQPMTVAHQSFCSVAEHCDLRPGVIGLGQVAARRSMTSGEWSACYSRYRRTMSFSNDLTILAAAAKSVL